MAGLDVEALKVDLRYFAQETLQRELVALGGRIEVSLCSRLQHVLDSWAFNGTRSTHINFGSSAEWEDNPKISSDQADSELHDPNPRTSLDSHKSGPRKTQRQTMVQSRMSQLPEELASRISMRLEESVEVEDKRSWQRRAPKSHAMSELHSSKDDWKSLAWVSQRLSSQEPINNRLSRERTDRSASDDKDLNGRTTVLSQWSGRAKSVGFGGSIHYSPREDAQDPTRGTYSALIKSEGEPLSDSDYDRYSRAMRDRVGSNWGRATNRFSLASKSSEDESPSAAKLVQSRPFSLVLGALIITNAIMSGALTDYQAKNHSTNVPWAFQVAELMFAAIFASEIILRMCLFGCSFFTMKGCVWNIFDLIMVTMQVAEDGFSLWIELNQTHSKPRRPTWLDSTALSFLHFLRSLLWTLILLAALTYMVGVYITQLVSDHRIHTRYDTPKEDSAELLVELYGTLDRSMLTLYESISDGVHWKHVVDPLRKDCSPWLAITFTLYISFVIFAMLNVIAGVYVDNVIRSSNEDKRRTLMLDMHQLFMQADADGSGTITWWEFGAQLESAEMRSYLKEIDLDLEEARELFLLLDIDEEGEIEIDQLVNGCVRLHGTAKAMDLAVMMQEVKQMARHFSTHAHVVEEQLTWLVQSTSNVHYDMENSLAQLQMSALRRQCSTKNRQLSDPTIQR